VALDRSHLRGKLGQQLEFNPPKEKFTGPSAKKANKLVKPEYRKPYAVPEKV
jgi:hypothetical protein